MSVVITQQELYVSLLPQVVAIVQEAGAILIKYAHGTSHSRIKPDGTIVTEADEASEKLLIEKLESILRGSSFYAEESGKQGESEYCWVIDPLDGTYNFARGFPYFCISVALTYKDVPVLAVVYQPLLKELFCAVKGKGSTLNGHPLAVSSQLSLSKSLIILDVTAVKRMAFHSMVRLTDHIAQAVGAVRNLGSAALDLASVAAGRAEGLFLYGPAWWDIAAGILLVQEAGGKVTDFQGNMLTIDNCPHVVTGGVHVHPHILALVNHLPEI